MSSGTERFLDQLPLPLLFLNTSRRDDSQEHVGAEFGRKRAGLVSKCQQVGRSFGRRRGGLRLEERKQQQPQHGASLPEPRYAPLPKQMRNKLTRVRRNRRLRFSNPHTARDISF